MTFPRGYQPKKQNIQDKKDYSKNNNNINDNENNKNNKNENKSLDQPITTIGEAVKEAIETGEEVVVAGPQTAGELTGITENQQNDNIQNISNENINDKTNLNNTLPDNSKIEVNVTKSPDDTSSSLAKEEKVILNPKESDTSSDEATIKTITTIPTEGVNVEAETDVTVPLQDKEENVKAETDVQVNPMTTNTSTNSQPLLESKDLEKVSPSFDKESSQLKNKIEPGHQSDATKSTISQESEKNVFQPSLSPSSSLSEEQSNDVVDVSNPYIMYTTYWQNFMSNWFNTYNEFLKNFMKMNSFWFRKS
jgi:hypothetical protein